MAAVLLTPHLGVQLAGKRSVATEPGFRVASLASVSGALADTTTDFMLRDPRYAEQHRQAGFQARWRMIA